MKYYIYLAAVCLLIVMMAGVTAASGTSLDLSVPSSFALSGAAIATDSDSNELVPGESMVEFIGGDQDLFIRVPAPARNDTRLVSLDDPESGIYFRNNTMLLPIYTDGVKAGSLVVTTENLTAGSEDFSGLVTGMELDTEEISSASFTAGAALFLQDLPEGAEYHISFTGNDTVEKALWADLEKINQAVADMSPTFSLAGDTEAGRDAVSDVIVTIRTDDSWLRLYEGCNVTFYRYYDDRLSRLEFKPMNEEESTTFQAIMPGMGQFVLVVAKKLDHTIKVTQPEDTQPMETGEVAVLGGVLAVLLLALAFMVGRVTKR
jgi:hypothetical protein